MDFTKNNSDDGWIGVFLFFALVVVIGLGHVAAHYHGYYRGRVAAQAELLKGGVK